MKLKLSTIYYVLAAVLLALAFGCSNKNTGIRSAGSGNSSYTVSVETRVQNGFII